MGGFKNESNNIAFEQGLFYSIVSHISRCCEKMRSDYKTTSKNLYNDEDKITNSLVDEYLNVCCPHLLWISQMPVHYVSETNTYKGRVDIAVNSRDQFKCNATAYYIIECKRLDGNTELNKKYVSEGISRFVISPEPKYSSYYGRNIMLGYVVKAINISENVAKIDCIQRKVLNEITIGDMVLICDDKNGFSHHKCTYQSSGTSVIELAHLFYDFSAVINEK